MRIKLDENLPDRLTPVLRELGHDVDTVVQEGLGGQDDEVLWPKVQEAQRFLITKDLGFSDEGPIHLAVTTASWCFAYPTTVALPLLSDSGQSSRPRPSTPGLGASS